MGRSTSSREHHDQGRKLKPHERHAHQAPKQRVDEHSSRSNVSASKSSQTSSSSGRASGSAPRSNTSQKSTTQRDGPNSPRVSPTSSPKASPRTPPARLASPAPAEQPQPVAVAAEAPAMPANMKNLDLSASLWQAVYKTDVAHTVPKKPSAPSKLGQDAKVGLNTFSVVKFPKGPVYQYDILVGNGTEKRPVIEKCWKSKAVQKEFKGSVLFDGNALAWSQNKLSSQEVRVNVNLDQENGRQPRPGKQPDIRKVTIRLAKVIDFTVFDRFLAGKHAPDTTCIEIITFFDHLLREHPSRNLLALKRSFYPRDDRGMDLGGGLAAIKGVYQSLRLAHNPQGACLTVNVDVANGTFFQPGMLLKQVLNVTGKRDPNDLINSIKRQGSSGPVSKDLRKLKRVHVLADHRRQPTPDPYCIDTFVYKSAKELKFDKGPKEGPTNYVTVYDYFHKEFNIRLQYPDLPVIKTTRNNYLPMELLRMKENQACRYKLDDKQTSQMIKFAVTPPAERWNAVEQGLRTLNWANDPVLQEYGLQISTNKTVVPARVLSAPKVAFSAGGTANPGTSGRWDLKGKKFLTSNTTPLKSWAICVISGSRGGKPDKSVIENFIRSFVNIYIGHGGKVENKQPAMILASGNDPSDWVTSTWNAAGSQSQTRPQILLFVLPDKDSQTYNRIKRSTDCRYGVVSQCMQYAHVQKAAPQYISNVCMKFNAKLGGSTCRAIGAKSAGDAGLFKAPTVIVGADVSHPAPGSPAGSVAAITCSMDRLALRYAAACDSNGHRVEMITAENIQKHLKPLLQHWCQVNNNGKLPTRLIYLRDGVSEQQFSQVIQSEVKQMKEIFRGVSPSHKVDFVVIIGQKRHHIRFFPERGDRNGNAFPGTLVETGATHPYENDFFMCSHAAIKGTARPTHWQVIMNEADMSNDEIYTLLYEHSYQYMRATTPVSIHPAIYYAHTAALRAVSHDPSFASNPDDSGETSKSGEVVIQPFLPMPDQAGIKTGMWYI